MTWYWDAHLGNIIAEREKLRTVFSQSYNYASKGATPLVEGETKGQRFRKLRDLVDEVEGIYKEARENDDYPDKG